RCTFNLMGPDTSDDFAVYSLFSSFHIEDCDFTGVRGIYMDNCYSSTLVGSRIVTTDIALSTLSVTDCSLLDNYFTSPTYFLDGFRFIIVGNYFLGALPSKLHTLESVWQGNYPHPEVNNY